MDLDWIEIRLDPSAYSTSDIDRIRRYVSSSVLLSNDREIIPRISAPVTPSYNRRRSAVPAEAKRKRRNGTLCSDDENPQHEIPNFASIVQHAFVSFGKRTGCFPGRGIRDLRETDIYRVSRKRRVILREKTNRKR